MSEHKRAYNAYIGRNFLLLPNPHNILLHIVQKYFVSHFPPFGRPNITFARTPSLMFEFCFCFTSQHTFLFNLYYFTIAKCICIETAHSFIIPNDMFFIIPIIRLVAIYQIVRNGTVAKICFNFYEHTNI